MSFEERTEGQDGAETVAAPAAAGAEVELVDDLTVRIAELDAIAWNLPRGPEEARSATEASDFEPAA